MTDSTQDPLPLREGDALSLPLRVGELAIRGGMRFRLSPTPEARAALAADLSLPRIRKLAFHGTITPEGRHDWRLEGRLGATVVQDCVVTAEPVTTRIDQDVLRRFLRDMPAPAESEAEMPDDDSTEALGTIIDPAAVMAEALALALPDYPRVPGAELPPPDEDAPEERPNPLAALAALRRDGD